MKINIITVSLFAMLQMTSCAPPSEPGSIKSTTSSTTPASTASTTSAATAVTFEAGGIDLGTVEMRALVRKCLTAKTFYDRQAGTCTSLPLANVACSGDKIKPSMTSDQVASYEKYMADPATLQGYTLDQCLDCPDPSANVLCKGTSATPPTGKGIRLFLVKDTTGGVLIQTLWLQSMK